MCGINGIINLSGQPVLEHEIEKMNAALAHRGPDDEGIWIDRNVGLGHRRLAILDLTPSAHQPMGNESKDVVIVYNGELYNHPDLRTQLQAAGHQYQSRSDSETLIHAYEEWGISCLDHFNGMFAFALLNNKTREFFLARDRFGVKPLYYYHDEKRFIFSSEIKAILTHPEITRSIHFPALHEYFTFQNTLTDSTLFSGVKILPAGCFLAIKIGQEDEPVVQRYWDFDFSKTILISKEDASDELLRLFNQSVRRQLMSDVPIACYLSGGMDSGSITAVARRHLGRLMTFTGGFDLSSASGLELGFDERARAEFLSNLLKTEHYEMVLHAGDMEHIMPELIWHLEDLRVGQCYPNYYLARLAGKFVKVVLSGAGGDELFAGYPWRYFRGLETQNGDYYSNYYDFWQRLMPEEDKPHFYNPDTWQQVKDHSTLEVFRSVFRQADLPLDTNAQKVNASLYFELKTFLHGLLVVEDKISMAHSLETRLPFLDNDLVDFACSIPTQYKLRHLDQEQQPVDENEPGKRLRMEAQSPHGKQILRETMTRVMPASVTRRVKQGFSAPDATWFRGESIAYVNQLLRNEKARIYEYFNPAYIARRLDEHTSGRQNNRLFIWSLLSFEWWLRTFLE